MTTSQKGTLQGPAIDQSEAFLLRSNTEDPRVRFEALSLFSNTSNTSPTPPTPLQHLPTIFWHTESQLIRIYPTTRPPLRCSTAAMSLQRSSQLLRPLCQSCAHSPSLLLPSSTISATTIIAGRSATRPYTVSASHQGKFIRKSPAAKQVNSTYGRILPKSIPRAIWNENYNRVKDSLERGYMHMYNIGQMYQVLDPKITPKIFLEIGRRLLDQAYSVSPNANADALKSIWKGDPARVYEVARSIFYGAPWDTHVLRWTTHATSDAGLVHTLALRVAHQIKQYGQGAHLPTSREIEMIKKIAYETDDPVALSVWADVARRWGQTEEALTIYHHLNKMVYPSSRTSRYNEDVTISNMYKPPWKALFDIYHEAERLDESEQMLEVGALIYRDPQALVTYAYFKKEKGDWESYEQCLAAAAMSGHGEACLRLGNYYYLIFKGEIPSRDQRMAEKYPWRARVSKILTYFASKQDYRRLAVNWYEMASAHGEAEGTRNFAVLMREDGHPNAWELMNRLRSEPRLWNNKNVIKLREQWDNPRFKPTLPTAWLEL